MQIRDYILRRLAVLPILIIGVSIIVFGLTRLGGSPIGIYLSHEMSAAEVAEIEARFHLDRPLPVQYFYWARGVLSGDFGWSGVAAAPVVGFEERDVVGLGEDVGGGEAGDARAHDGHPAPAARCR